MSTKGAAPVQLKTMIAGHRNAAVAIAIACALSAVTSQSTLACGPFFKEAVFVNSVHPDLPLQHFAAGELGAIKPSYARSYLVVAYRYLTGIKTDPAQQKEFVLLWDRRLEPLDNQVVDGVKMWTAARKKVVGAPAKGVDAYQQNGYSGYLSYNPDAFIVATQTLERKIAKYGAGDSRVKSWVLAQDAIFGANSNSDGAATGQSSQGTTGDTAGNTSSGTAGDTSGNTKGGAKPTVTSSNSAEGDAESREDADYQSACDSFYGGKYDDAAEKFQAIGKDHSSAWQPWGDYLAARAYCRKATLADVLSIEDLKQAQKLVDSVLQSKDNDKMHQKAQGLNSFLEYRLSPSERAKQAVSALMSDAHKENLTEALGDYTIILDKVLEKQAQANQPSTSWRKEELDGVSPSDNSKARGDKTSTLPGSPILSYAALTAVLLLGSHRLWRRRNIASARVGQHSTIAVILSLCLLSCGLASCTKSGVTVKSETKTTETVAPKSEAKLPSAADVVLDDDMTKWILNFQDQGPKAIDTAYAEWKKSEALPWLVSVVVRLKATDPRKDEVLADAADVPQDSPAYLTLECHRIRLLAEGGKSQEAATHLSSLLKQSGKMLPPSTRNLLFELGVSFVGSLTEFAKLAAPSPADVSWDYDYEGEDDEAVVAKMNQTGQYPVYDGCLTQESADIINKVAPLSTILALASNTSLPVKARTDVAQAGWVRSVMLNDEKMAMTLSPVLAKLRPQLSKSLAAYDAAGSGTEKEFAALSTILHNPGMSPYVTSGLSRETKTAFDKIDSYRDNWWCHDPPTKNLDGEDQAEAAEPATTSDAETAKKPDAKSPNVAFLTPAERTQGGKDFAALTAQGAAPDVLTQRVLKLSHTKPKDPRLPELLHLAVTTTRYGCTDDNTTALSKQAFQELHKNFPSNPWTKKTKFWF